MPNKSQQLLSAARTATGYYKYVPLFCVYIVDDLTGRTGQREGSRGP